MSFAIALGQIGADDATVASLQSVALRDESPSVRLAVVKVLPRSIESVPTLMRAITDKDVTVEHAALATLAEIGPSAEEAVPAVMAVLSDINQDQDCRSQAACTLGRISSGTSDVITTLQRESLIRPKAMHIVA